MSLFNVFGVAGSGMSAQSVRLNTTASNLANADSVSGDPNKVYRAREPVFSAVRQAVGNDAGSVGVRVDGVQENTRPPEQRYDPGNPAANKDGYVFAPNVNTVEEMVNMISASRSYQNNAEVLNTSKDLLLRTLQMGK